MAAANASLGDLRTWTHHVRELFYLFKGFITCLYSVTFSITIALRHGHTLNFLSCYSSPVSLLTITKAPVFLFIVCIPPNTLTSSAQTRNFVYAIYFQTLLVSLNLPNDILQKLKSNCAKASPCFKPFLTWDMSNKCYLPCHCHRFHLDTFLLVWQG